MLKKIRWVAIGSAVLVGVQAALHQLGVDVPILGQIVGLLTGGLGGP